MQDSQSKYTAELESLLCIGPSLLTKATPDPLAASSIDQRARFCAYGIGNSIEFGVIFTSSFVERQVQPVDVCAGEIYFIIGAGSDDASCKGIL